MLDPRRVATAQAAWWIPTGVLPLISRRAFEAVTGPKAEWWLVETVGLLVTAIGGGLALGAATDRVTPELQIIGVGSAASLAGIDVAYYARGRLPWTYLVDAAVEIAIVAGWLAARRRAATSGVPGGDGASTPGP
jgi:hypothetical protein